MHHELSFFEESSEAGEDAELTLVLSLDSLSITTTCRIGGLSYGDKLVQTKAIFKTSII